MRGARRSPGTVPLGSAAPALLCLGLLALSVPQARAQSTTASIRGVVRTRDGGPAPGAVIVARAGSTGAERSASADEQGRYRFDLLSPGDWTITARLGDALSSAPRTVTLSLMQSLALDLEVGSELTESVIVRAEAPLVDPARTAGELRLSSGLIDGLPLNGRSFTDLALIDGSVLPAPPGGFYGERGSVFVVNGQSGRANSFLVDGLDNNDLTSGTALNSFFSQQVIREFVVLTHQFSPEFGRAGGGILNIITEQGTNEKSGSAFVQGVDRQVNAPGDFLGTLPHAAGRDDTSSRLQGGFRLGGPLRRDRAFYFLAYEHQEDDAVLPFTGIGRDRTAGGFLVAPNRDDNVFLRTDFNLGGSQYLMVRLSADDRISRGLNVGGRNTPEAGFRVDEKDVQLAAGLTSVLSPVLLNEARLFVGSSAFDQFANSGRPGVDRPSGTFGGNNLNRQARDEDRVQLVDNLTWTRGAHTLKFGVDVIRSRTGIRTRFNPNGNFLYQTDAPFEPGDCGDLNSNDVATYGDNPIPCDGTPMVDDDGDGKVDEPGLIRTYPLVFQFIDGEPVADLNDTRLGFFAQDSWHAGERLVLDYGLRYDLSTFRLPEGTSVPSFIENGGADRDTDNLAPRFGFAFTPRPAGRIVLRGGAGVFYDKLVLGFPAVASITSGTQIGLFFPQGAALEITEDVVEQVGIDAVKAGLVFPPELILRFSTGTRLDTPYTVEYALGADWAVGTRGSIEAGLTRALGYHQALLRDLNPVLSKNADGSPHHRDTTVGSIAAIVTEGRSWYNGLKIDYRLRGKDSWWSASYTLSRAMDLGSDPLREGIWLPPDSDNIQGERARSDADRRHRLVLAGGARLPWLGLRVSTVVQLATAAPFNVTTGRDENVDGITTDRPDGVRRNTGESTSLGPINLTRDDANVLRGQLSLPLLPAVQSIPSPPHFAQVDFRLSRPFAWGERHAGGEFFFQVFNALDRWNGGPIDGRVTSFGFGRPIGQLGPPRTIEAGLKIGF
ncbi:MAG TPA: carboxypeptidase regulatory-like domain-containing protein [Candidatus Polarisedimenticolia bacterium]|nr:carboxypeptidase regulatory-like domain-containing protein [Candidatus Polarisedimenticolia bacterium]